MFDPEAGTWQIGPKLTPARGHFGMGLIDDTIVGAGGWVNHSDVGTNTSMVWRPF